MTKAGRVAEAFKEIKRLPSLIDMDQRRKALKFERGLSSFLDRGILRSFNSFKTMYDEGQAIKKRGVIQLVNSTISGNKKVFNRWIMISEKRKMTEQCRKVMEIFNGIHFVIKSVSDNAFLGSNENMLKERALMQLFRNLSSNVAGTFKQWRNANQVEKMR